MYDIYGVPSYILIPVAILLSLYLYFTRNFGYWKRRGIPEVPPLPITGSLRFDLYSHEGKTEQKWSRKYGKIFGIYEGANPVLMIADPELLKDILVKDFHVFPEFRDLRFGDPITERMMFAQRGEKWKEMRSIISPTFSSGKMKMMFTLINDCGKMLANNLKESMKDNKEVDVAKFFEAYVIDVIARCAFGIKVDSNNDPNNAFVKAARNAFTSVSWRVTLATLFPGLAKFIRLSVFDTESSLFFKNIIEDVIKERKKQEQKHNIKDLLQLLIEAEGENDRGEKKKLTSDEVVSQCIMFFIGGFFNLSSTLTFVAHQLAVSPDIQQKLIDEIDQNTKDVKEIDYDVLLEMTYLDAFVQEILRYYSPAPKLERKCVEDYKLGDTGWVIPKSTLVMILTYVMNHNPEYFSHPEEFDPDRFLPGNREKIHPYANVPFGSGPRGCLGIRFALMEIKIAVVSILQKVKFKPGAKTKREPDYYPSKSIHSPRNVSLKLELKTEN